MKTTRTDLELVTKLLGYDDLGRGIREACEKWREELTNGKRRLLTHKQRDWAEEELDKRAPTYLNLVSAGKVPIGRPVETPDVLRPSCPFAHPLKPPQRRVS